GGEAPKDCRLTRRPGYAGQQQLRGGQTARPNPVARKRASVRPRQARRRFPRLGLPRRWSGPAHLVGSPEFLQDETNPAGAAAGGDGRTHASIRRRPLRGALRRRAPRRQHRATLRDRRGRSGSLPPIASNTRQIRARQPTSMDMNPAELGAAMQLWKDLARVEQAVRIESAFEALLMGEIAFVEHCPHKVALFDADPVLTGQHSTDFDTELEDIGTKGLGTLDLAGLVGVVEDKRMEIAVAGM